MPRLELVDRRVEDLVSPTRNTRKLDARQIRQVANSIKALGFCDPPLINDNNQVLDGVVRVEAARLLGLETIPCVCARHLSKDRGSAGATCT